MILQETFVVWDTLFYDNAIASSYSTEWDTSRFKNLQLSRDNDGTLLECSNSDMEANYPSIVVGNTTRFPINSVVELDIVETSGQSYVQISMYGASTVNNGLYSFPVSTPFHLKIVITENGSEWYVNNSTTPFSVRETQTDTFSFWFVAYKNSNKDFHLKYKNLKIYSI